MNCKISISNNLTSFKLSCTLIALRLLFMNYSVQVSIINKPLVTLVWLTYSKHYLPRCSGSTFAKTVTKCHYIKHTYNTRVRQVLKATIRARHEKGQGTERNDQSFNHLQKATSNLD